MDRLAPILFGAAVAAVVLVAGALTAYYKVFPGRQIVNVVRTATEAWQALSPKRRWYFIPTERTAAAEVYDRAAVAPGLTLISGLLADKRHRVSVIDLDGTPIQVWNIVVFKLWPGEMSHVPPKARPKSLPGGRVHGMVVMENGDLVFNFAPIGMLRLDPCGALRWRLSYRAHHSLQLDADGTFWASGLVTRSERDPRRRNYATPFEDYTVIQVSPEGRLMREIFVFDVLQRNGLEGLMYLSSRRKDTVVKGDTLHLNDVDVFPAGLREGVFRRGDVMVSLRNINTILVFDPKTLRVKFRSTGAMLRQHDPDFIDGNTISVYDNNNLTPDDDGVQSRIVRISALDGSVTESYRGRPDAPFYGRILGKHQTLDNGNLLITEATQGRAFEVTADGRLVWEFLNFVGDGMLGYVGEAQRLPVRYDRAFFAEKRAACGAGQG